MPKRLRAVNRPLRQSLNTFQMERTVASEGCGTGTAEMSALRAKNTKLRLAAPKDRSDWDIKRIPDRDGAFDASVAPQAACVT